MRNDFAIDHTRERYVVEVDGQAKAEYRIFVKALKAGLQLRQEFPNSHVTLRDVGEETAH
jgi:ethanolamine utilization protein EutA (predicted chaperonin)